jgi:uncharacterized protein (UPF0335 family)
MLDRTPQPEGAAARLNAFIERIERLNEEKAALNEAIKEIFVEAKGTGFEPKAMRRIIQLRKMDSSARTDLLNAEDTYLVSLGMVAGAAQ